MVGGVVNLSPHPAGRKRRDCDEADYEWPVLHMCPMAFEPLPLIELPLPNGAAVSIGVGIIGIAGALDALPVFIGAGLAPVAAGARASICCACVR